jgi:hypothetical protein
MRLLYGWEVDACSLVPGGVPTDKLWPVPTTPFQSQDVCAMPPSDGAVLVDPEPLDPEPPLETDPEPFDPEFVLPFDPESPWEPEFVCDPEPPVFVDPDPPGVAFPLPQLARPITVEATPIDAAMAVKPNRRVKRATATRCLLISDDPEPTLNGASRRRPSPGRRPWLQARLASWPRNLQPCC